MSQIPAHAPITEDDDFIATALERASIPTLMMSIIHMTGDTSLLRGALPPGHPTLGAVRRVVLRGAK